ncbi:MAG: hypothetical protein C0448_12260 [Sphingobacteriaceae bacterium]|nr:hypothetical protein [Sphingobacteriaceae bacterium]
MKKLYFPLIVALWSLSLNAQVYTNAFKIQSSGSDRGMRITTDNSGNVITTGYFEGLTDFDPSANSATLTPNGSFQDVYIAKYDASLNYIWSVKFGTSGTDFPYALAVDASNNIIIGGDVSSNNRDGFVNKYDANGNVIWTISLGGVNKDVVYGVNTDAAKNVYVTGYFSNTVDFDPSAGTYTLASNGGRDIFLAKYDSTGKFRWAFNLGGTISTAYEEGGQDLVIAGPNIYLTGNFEGTTDFNPAVASNTLMSNGSLDMFIAKYDTTGAYVWAISMGSNNKHDYSYGIDVDASENIYITGGFEETVDFDPSVGTATLTSASVSAQDIFVAKYNSSGIYQWAFKVGGSSLVDDHAFDIDVTPIGDIYICGEVWGSADFDPSIGVYNINPSNDQIFFAKYNNAGGFVWAFDIGATSSNGSADNGYGVKATATGSLYVTGDFNGTADFDPSANTANLTSSAGDAFVGVYGTSVFVGVNTIELDGASIKAFPNPSSGQVNFVYTEFNNEEWSLEITDVTGKPVLKTENIKNEIINMNIEGLSSGVYFYSIKTNNQISTKKLIIQ